MDEAGTFTVSSGNIFADLELDHPEERLLKADLAIAIRRLVEGEGTPLEQAAAQLGLAPIQLDRVLDGRVDDLSVEQLLVLVNRLGHPVEVRIMSKDRAPTEARTSVVVA